jgi:hypothetical protein
LYSFPRKKTYTKGIRGDHFRFDSVFIKKSNQTEFFFLKKNRNRTKTDWVRFRFLGQKPVWLGFFRFCSVFSFGSVFFPVSVRFFRFFAYKTGTEPAGFFKNLIGLIDFFSVRFFRLFFFQFSWFNRFSSFFAHSWKGF